MGSPRLLLALALWAAGLGQPLLAQIAGASAAACAPGAGWACPCAALRLRGGATGEGPAREPGSDALQSHPRGPAAPGVAATSAELSADAPGKPDASATRVHQTQQPSAAVGGASAGRVQARGPFGPNVPTSPFQFLPRVHPSINPAQQPPKQTPVPQQPPPPPPQQQGSQQQSTHASKAAQSQAVAGSAPTLLRTPAVVDKAAAQDDVMALPKSAAALSQPSNSAPSVASGAAGGAAAAPGLGVTAGTKSQAPTGTPRSSSMVLPTGAGE
jgi:hypothetical protein